MLDCLIPRVPATPPWRHVRGLPLKSGDISLIGYRRSGGAAQKAGGKWKNCDAGMRESSFTCNEQKKCCLAALRGPSHLSSASLNCFSSTRRAASRVRCAKAVTALPCLGMTEAPSCGGGEVARLAAPQHQKQCSLDSNYIATTALRPLSFANRAVSSSCLAS
ncbi:hypothetical protein M011DRAFT_166915 [Sporormia fimetaria CBS 119925]|uniref:Uncharacterized protein n=1 Tax=Sporormia fimetaria CBS 119925 TaxID=1340428 RepID=A0A6A6V3A7_9PLEO|nr:hypothetical protein M011DRAFT_166915 [Sporormia fimetaria CBS 119925]